MKFLSAPAIRYLIFFVLGIVVTVITLKYKDGLRTSIPFSNVYNGGYTIDTSRAIFMTALPADSAHLMSVRFLQASGYCDDPANHPLNMFEFSDTTINDVVLAMNAIKKQTDSMRLESPRFFRAVFGRDNRNQTKLIVAGLDRNNTEYYQFTKIINGTLPCPFLCDFTASRVVMGTPARPDPCQ